ncbi:MAG: tetratricopeptide repeat protein [Selenomonadaceae bacterium]|nr:tetratricopeptide repeat protein [Selenomonadaceae bacterium]
MNRPASSKFVPGLPSDDDIDATTNENAAANPNSVKIYDGVADCAMNDADTIKNVKIRAKDLAQEKLLNKIADYVDGFLRDRLLTFPDDEIFSIANEIYHITDVKYNTFDSDDNLIIRATVLAQIDDNDIMNCLVRFFKERIDLKSQNEALSKENETLCKENEDLRRQIAEFPNKIILANQKKVDVNELRIGTGDYEDAIKLCDEAIELNPYDYELYENRGAFYQELKQYEQAIQDDSKAIELNPYFWWLYNHRGFAYQKFGDEAKAQADFAKAEELRKKS